MPPALVDRSNPDLTAMAFGELSRLQDISCLSRTVQAFPDTRHGSLTASASYEFENRSGQSRKAAFGLTRYLRVVLANGASVPFSVGDYQEYNEAMLEVTLPPDREIDLVIRYGGFPRNPAPSPPCRVLWKSAAPISVWPTGTWLPA